MVERDPEKRLSVFDYAEMKLTIADLLDEQVDVVNRATLRERIKDNFLADAVYAF